MPQNIIEIDGAVGKTVQKITVTNESYFRVITVRFSDQTAIHFTLHPRIEIEPELLDWKTGDGEIMEYPDLRGKVIRQVKFVNHDNYTAFNLEFEDNTLASFRVAAKISLSLPPEIAKLKGGDLVGWKKLKARPGTLRILGRNE